jgi:hypothetical protein
LILRKTRAFLWRPSVAPTAAVLTAAAAAGSTILLDTFYTPNAYSSSHYIAIISEFEMMWAMGLLARWFLTFFELVFFEMTEPDTHRTSGKSGDSPSEPSNYPSLSQLRTYFCTDGEWEI